MEAIVYRTENKVNGNFYYGVHKGNNPNYLGSGKLLNRAIDKYGKENFVRRTIKSFDTEEEAYAFESLMVDEDLIGRDDCYNLKLGGNGGWSHIERAVEKHSEESKRKMSESSKGQLAWNKGLKMPEGHKSKSSERYNSKKVVIDGVEYKSIREASRATGIDRRRITDLLK